MESAVVEARDLTKWYMEGRERIEVLSGISLSIRPGEIVSLEGPSGSGKTTLLSILGCLLTPTSGALQIDGRTIDPGDTDLLVSTRKSSIGFVFQQFNLFPALTARENVEFALGIKGVIGDAARQEAERVLRAVGLADRLDFLPRDLSGGQKQRVAIARALARSPRLLLADEPTANLDSRTATQILGLFRELTRGERTALIIVTHDARVREYADRTLRLDGGRLLS